MYPTGNDYLTQVDKHLNSSNLSWLFGAGISKGAKIPLMSSLTKRVFAKANADNDKKFLQILEIVKAELPEDAHIEYILSHIGDLVTLAERSKGKKVQINSITVELIELRELHTKVLKWISETIRWGFVEGNEEVGEMIGNHEKPIVQIDAHVNFISVLFNRSQAGVAERRGPVRLFTTNYDTLLEDALALCCIPYWDGFSGGAVAFRNYQYGGKEPDPSLGYRAYVIKLHGSIDWYQDSNDNIWRVRDSDIYPKKSAQVLIYPQATKYLATQRDPFAAQFDLFRRTLGSNLENVLAICGYSFGDEHINKEIELALQSSKNKTTIVVFSSSVNDVLNRWQSSTWSKRLYIISKSGLYIGSEGPFFSLSLDKVLDWWTFDGVTKLLNNGAEVYIQ